MENSNLWRVIGRGVAAENLDLEDVWLEVFCPELTGFVDGEITNHSEDLITHGVDDRGHHYTSKITTCVTVRCKWKPNGTNRITAPNVRRGERVEIWQYADVDRYWWSITGEDDNLRRLETVTHAYSNTKDESVKELTKDNTYSTTVSTHQKKIELSTSKSDGEPFEHIVQIDTANGLFTYKDDIGNVIQVNSKGSQIFIETSNGSKVVLDRGNIDVTAPGNITLNAKSVTINAPTTINGNTSTHGSLTNNGTNVGSTHTHGGVRTGVGSTSSPR